MQRLGNLLRDLVREGIAAYAHVAEKRMHGDSGSFLSVFYLVLPLAHLLGGATELSYLKITPRQMLGAPTRHTLAPNLERTWFYFLTHELNHLRL